MNRVIFLIDGFNVYHSIKDAKKQLENRENSLAVNTLKWLNYYTLCESYLSVIGRKSYVQEIIYFSAFAQHRLPNDPKIIERHSRYIEALKSVGLKIVLGRFKRRSYWCDECDQEKKRYEEKETDVAIGVKLIEIFMNDICDTAVLVTGDTDLVPAVKCAQHNFPNKRVVFAFPFKRKNLDLDTLVNKDTITIKPKSYKKHQLPNPTISADGTKLFKPDTW